ncbi:DUF3043 domain-containing protein [Nesterenkonia flava]|uniref:DUF3043 domain-containing protein n=1 Tax=Nesterenkonia flava TaxID=469799 RepID=A0ABU1FPT7_9MICC|nr:DUF3043 domain-containing protein [Nesterenkonia flava]MDR5710654.1 DUF3043 domain-containing protein [Nesterenkonia flava]
MLGRKKKTQNEVLEAEAAQTQSLTHEAQPKLPQKKGVPTPTRREREAARRRPLVHNDRKAARAAQRKAIAEQRAKMRHAMETGDDRHLPARDRGPQRRFVRDWVDARSGIGEWLLIGLVIFLFGSLLMTPETRALFAFSMWGLMALVIVECWWVARKVRLEVDKKFGAENREKGLRFYAVMRSMQMRRLRLPKPLVRRGEFPS